MFRLFRLTLSTPVIGLLALAVQVCFIGSALAAQSTADVPISDEMKRAVLTTQLGERADEIPRDEPYVIGVGDIISVSIFEEGDMSAVPVPGIARQGDSQDAPRMSGGGARVMMDGRISLKNIGDVEVVGLTLTELADYLKEIYSLLYDNPIITTTLVQSNSLRYTVMGEVVQPGIYYLDFPINLVQVVARSGGFTEWASREITVVRKELKGEDKKLFKKNTLKFEYDDLLDGENLEKNVALRSGDIVIVK